MKTKSSKCDRIGDTSGLTASYLAAKYNRREIESLIKEVVNPVLCQAMTHSKWLIQRVNVIELPLIRFSIVSCNSTFHPDEISSNEYLRQVLRTIYMDLKESKDRWKAVMANICDSLENVSRSVSTDLKGRSTSKENFFSGIINA